MVVQTPHQNNFPPSTKIGDFSLLRQLSILRYGFFIIFPLLFMRELPHHAQNVYPITIEEQLSSTVIILSSICTTLYAGMRKFFYNSNNFKSLGIAVGGCGIITFGANMGHLPYDYIGFLFGFLVALMLSWMVARFDSLYYQKYSTKCNNISAEKNILEPVFARHGWIRINLIVNIEIYLNTTPYDKNRTLGGYLIAKEGQFVEGSRTRIEWNWRESGWFYQYFDLKKGLKKQYRLFLNGLHELTK